MAELKQVIASNLIELRTNAGMKQAELAEKINYSDKSVSKWERGEAVPDVAVLKSIADIFGVTLDYLVSSHDEWEEKQRSAKSPAPQGGTPGAINFRMISSVAIMGIWALALLLFIIFWLRGSLIWLIFLGAVPVSLITLLVLHTLWGGGKYNRLIISALMLSILALVYFSVFSRNWWQIFLLAIPAECIIIFCFRIKKPQK